MARIDFDSQNVPAAPVLPEGDYECLIVKSDIKTTKKGDGRYVALELVVVDGDYKKWVLFDNITLDNPSEKATAMGQRKFSKLVTSCGHLKIDDTSELHNIPIVASVKIEDNGEFGDQNRITKYRKIGEATETETASRSAPKRPQAAVAGGGKPPWASK